MKYGSLFFLLFFGISANAQLDDCSSCDSIAYTTKDVAKKSLYDLQLLRNEIFARHQYVFKDQRLLEYFQEYLWYQPDHNNPANVIINPIETANITLFKEAEERIKKKRKRLFSELRELKRALREKDTITVDLFMDGALPKQANLGVVINELSTIFSEVDLKNVNWYKDTALYKKSTDNGFLVHEITLKIQATEVILSTADIKHSEIMTEPFRYGSNYYSEDEYASMWIFRFDGEKLRLLEHVVAG